MKIRLDDVMQSFSFPFEAVYYYYIPLETVLMFAGGMIYGKAVHGISSEEDVKKNAKDFIKLPQIGEEGRRRVMISFMNTIENEESIGKQRNGQPTSLCRSRVGCFAFSNGMRTAAGVRKLERDCDDGGGGFSYACVWPVSSCRRTLRRNGWRCRLGACGDGAVCCRAGRVSVASFGEDVAMAAPRALRSTSAVHCRRRSCYSFDSRRLEFAPVRRDAQGRCGRR